MNKIYSKISQAVKTLCSPSLAGRAGVGLLLLACTACTGDLDLSPEGDKTAAEVYGTTEGCQMALTKIYASYVTVGQAKENLGDFSTNNGYDLMRGYVNMQEMPTDEMAPSWLEHDHQDGLCYIKWTADDPWVSDVYYRLYYTIALANDYIANTKNNGNQTVQQYVGEARFLRALAYYMVLDLYGKGPFVDENTGIGSYIPEAYTNKQLFDYIEGELKAIADNLPTKSSVEYGRASSGAAYALLAKLYLNAEVYGGGNHYADCVAACDKVIAQGYTLEEDYQKLFNADNDKRTNEIIFSLNVDATNTVTWGATTYLVCGAIGNSNNQDATAYGAASGWGSFRARGELTSLFEEGDCRALFWTNDSKQYFEGNPIDNQGFGWFGCKYTNLTDEGETASNTADGGVCTDYPVLRLADVMLMKAEAMLRNGSAAADVLPLIQPLYDRAFGEGEREVLASEVDLQFLLDERARELWWECTRRTDLVRYGMFTTNKYLWEWKGGAAAGTSVSESFNTYPIPAAEQSANYNLR